ncbi:MAG: hypothetical protein HOV81_07090 [Kofleriaceae bacterium]|nr:hypothetical protein [Kofleriaceae bacterium]
MSWLPPYGWWVREHEHETVLRGWDWMYGAITLSHGVVTLPFSIWLAGSNLWGILGWLAVSLFVAAGVGWAVVVDAEGFVFSRTWLGIPLTRKRLPHGAPLEVREDDYVPEGADFARHISLGAGDGHDFGVRANADQLKDRLDAAVARHAGSRPR